MAAKKAARKKATLRRPARTAAAKKPRPRKRRQQPETLRLRSAAPGFTVDDVERSLSWYRDVLGFVVKERWERDGKLMGVEMGAGIISFYLGQDDWKKGHDRQKGEGFRIYCTTGQDLDTLAAGIRLRGGTLDQEPVDQPWGTREFALSDPDGFKITIASLE